LKKEKYDIMKLRNYSLLVFALFIALFTACDDRDYDVPPITAPMYEGKATHTIKEFKEQFTSDFEEITGHVVITGVVTANDESGNLYKKMIIQDNEQAIELSIDKNSVYNTFRLGQQVFVECEGLYAGTYGDKQLIGYKYQNNSGEWQVGRMPGEIFDNQVFRHDFPGEDPKADTVKIADLTEATTDRLVCLKNVKFTDGGDKTFADQGPNATARKIVDVEGKSIIVYTSKYANFANKVLPKGWGNLTGIMSSHKKTWQLVIRDTTDIENFVDDGTTPEPEPEKPVTSIDEDFESGTDKTDVDIKGWSIAKPLGDRNWQTMKFTDKNSGKTNTYAQASAHFGKSDDYEYWLITPAIDMDKATNKVMNFETAKAYWQSTSSLEIYVLDSKDLSAANKEKLDVRLAKESDADHTFIESGDVDLSAQSGIKYIGFKYVAKGGESNSTTFRVDNFKFGVSE
jgi:hypothetical protein